MVHRSPPETQCAECGYPQTPTARHSGIRPVLEFDRKSALVAAEMSTEAFASQWSGKKLPRFDSGVILRLPCVEAPGKRVKIPTPSRKIRGTSVVQPPGCF